MKAECVIDGCERPQDAKGYCKLHYARFHRHGDPLAGRTPEGAPNAFLEAAKCYEGDECLIWPYAKTQGYACIRIEGKTEYVAQLLCEHAYGPRPSPAHGTLHSCDRGHRGCIAKNHLSWGTQADNGRDNADHGRSFKGIPNELRPIFGARIMESKSVH